MSDRRRELLSAARTAADLWRANRILTPGLEEALDRLAALGEGPGPGNTTTRFYLVLRDDWGHHVLQATNDDEARRAYLADRPRQGYRGIYRDTGIPPHLPVAGEA